MIENVASPFSQETILSWTATVGPYNGKDWQNSIACSGVISRLLCPCSYNSMKWIDVDLLPSVNFF